MTDNEPMSWADIAAQIRGIGEDEGSQAQVTQLGRAPFRVVVATDFSQAATPLAVLKAYAALFAADAPVELVFAVPHEPEAEDAACVQVLLEGLDEGVDVAPVSVESFEEAATKSCYAAVVSNGDLQVLIMELGVALTTMHQLAVLVGDADRLAGEPEPVEGPNENLRRRFVAFSEIAAPEEVVLRDLPQTV